MSGNSIFLNQEAEKAASFRANEQLNELIGRLKELLGPIQTQVESRFTAPKQPVGLVVGSPRSGTTLMMQFLASTGSFSYPSNVLARFAYSPHLGAMVQQMLFNPEFDFHGDFSDIQSDLNFSSNLGKSKGALAVNEFQHFFRCHMANFDPEYLDENALNKVDTDGIRQGLASIEAVFEKPFVSKGFMLQFNISFFAKAIAQLFFIHVKRDPLMTMQSILQSREKYYGQRTIWYSVKPKEFNALKEMSVYHQIAGQVFYTNQAIEAGLAGVSEDRQLTVDYESFCSNPAVVYKSIVEKYEGLGCPLNPILSGEQTFSCSNVERLPAVDLEGLTAAYDEFSAGRISV